MKNKSLLDQEIAICNIHAQRLQLAIEKTTHLQPFSAQILQKLDDIDLGYLELLTNRLAKLQDSIGEKIFKLILQKLKEEVEKKSFIDILNRLEKLEILPSAEWWLKLRILRNILTHEYPDNPGFIAENLNNAVVQARKLLEFWQTLQKFIIKNNILD